ncbi:cation diffusion facilitator family transporter [Verrucomicrobiota bacterium]
MMDERCISCSKRVEWMVLGINLGLFVVKGSFAILSSSKSLLADAFESLANVIVTIVVLVSLRIAAKQADHKYPYGYGKMEFLASGIVNMLLMLAAIYFIFAAFKEMVVVGPEKPPGLIAIAAALISIVANQLAFGYGRCVGERFGSAAILSNAMVNRADIGTSVAVIVAVVGSNLGFGKLDHIVAVAIGILIIKVTSEGLQKAVKGLMDVSVGSDEGVIRSLTGNVEGVEHVGDVKARLVGRRLWIDLNVFVSADQVLKHALETTREIRSALREKINNVSEVSIQLFPHESRAIHAQNTGRR